MTINRKYVDVVNSVALSDTISIDGIVYTIKRKRFNDITVASNPNAIPGVVGKKIMLIGVNLVTNPGTSIDFDDGFGTTYSTGYLKPSIVHSFTYENGFGILGTVGAPIGYSFFLKLPQFVANFTLSYLEI